MTEIDIWIKVLGMIGYKFYKGSHNPKLGIEYWCFRKYVNKSWLHNPNAHGIYII